MDDMCRRTPTAPFPQATVRDLLGITRALYRAELAAIPLRLRGERINRLEAIGKTLREALDLATRCERGTMGRRAAWDKAERVTADFGRSWATQCRSRPQ